MSFEREKTNIPEYYYRNVRCDWCKSELKMVAESKEPYRCLQPEDALIIQLQGAFGMMIDFISNSPNTTLICCKACVPKLCAENKPIDDIINYKGEDYSDEYE